MCPVMMLKRNQYKDDADEEYHHRDVRDNHKVIFKISLCHEDIDREYCLMICQCYRETLLQKCRRISHPYCVMQRVCH